MLRVTRGKGGRHLPPGVPRSSEDSTPSRTRRESDPGPQHLRQGRSDLGISVLLREVWVNFLAGALASFLGDVAPRFGTRAFQRAGARARAASRGAGGHRSEAHRTAGARGPGPGPGRPPPADKGASAAGLGSARPGRRSGPAAAPGPPARAGQSRRGRPGGGKGRLGGRPGVYFSSSPPFPGPPCRPPFSPPSATWIFLAAAS